MHQIPLTKQTGPHPGEASNTGIPKQSNNEACIIYRDLMKVPTSPHAYVNQQPPNPTPFNFNESIVELFRCQTRTNR